MPNLYYNIFDKKLTWRPTDLFQYILFSEFGLKGPHFLKAQKTEGSIYLSASLVILVLYLVLQIGPEWF